jgi:hypothetical protein
LEKSIRLIALSDGGQVLQNGWSSNEENSGSIF